MRFWNKTENDTKKELAISVPDLKQYLIKEYERVQEMKDELAKKDEQLKAAEKFHSDYLGLGVVASEYKREIQGQKWEISKLKTTIENYDKEKAANNEKLNTFVIASKNAEEDKKAFVEECLKRQRKELVREVSELKGNITKAQIIELLKEQI